MGKVARIDSSGRCIQRDFSSRRNVRLDLSDEKIVGIDRDEYRGGLLSKRGRGGGTVLQIAMGSASKLEYQLLLAHDLNYMHAPEYQRLEEKVVEVKRMLPSLMRKVKADS